MTDDKYREALEELRDAIDDAATLATETAASKGDLDQTIVRVRDTLIELAMTVEDKAQEYE